ncbi:MAG: toprim domain-containing protein [Bacteroides sp.]|uniref:toprim domain-containing protein n=1 Tax=Bacteroides sp. TaxID=29523 RepID=UPI0026DF7EEA|nr:toprim domain-containing protein [Bacteroides sp.]MDO5419757.1 toprim domain-containing protein [Bacteroides sp.]
MKDKNLTHDDFMQRLDIQKILLDAGYCQNRRFGLRLPSFIRKDSEGRRIRGDKFVITRQGKCCLQSSGQKEYNVVSFIKEHPTLFAEYHEGIDPNRLVNLVCNRLLDLSVGEREGLIVQSKQDIRPFDIADYDLHKFDLQDREVQKKFYPYFKIRGIDLCTQYAFHRHFCLATKREADGATHPSLAFPLTLPKGDERVVGFEERNRTQMDNSDSYQDKFEEGNSNKGVWIASPARTPLAEARHIYWFGSAYDAMAYYQLHEAQHQELQKAVFVSTGGQPTEKLTRGVLELTLPATQHICFDNSREGWDFARELQKEIYRTIHSAIEETPERKPYLDSIGDGHDLDEGELELLPRSVQESYIRFDTEQDKFMSMRWDERCTPEEIKGQADITGKCYLDYREKLREFLGIDKEHDVSFVCEEAEYRHTSWDAQLLAVQQREASVNQKQEREENAEQEQQTRFRR